jgi:Mlc titration factor MtfA (ptsG expression regulator)
MASDLKLTGKASPLDYGTNALTEDFAVSCEVLVTITPEVFKKEFPGRYAILKKLLRL